MQQMAEGLRGDLGQVTAAHAGLYRQLNQQSEKLDEIAAEAHSTKIAVDSLEASLTEIQTKFRVLLTITCVGLGAILILAVAILLRH
jgi:hypothetical protein